MPDGIEQFEGKAAFASARELPWHKLGTVTDSEMTAEEGLKLAHMADWNIRKEPIQTVSGLEIADMFGVVRDNPFTGEPEAFSKTTVGNVWEPTQNEDHAEFLNTLMGVSGAHLETLGSIDGGKRTFVTMKMPDTILIGGVDPVETYAAAMNSHDGTSAFVVVTTDVRVVCKNTLSAALRGAQRIAKVRHTRGQGGAIARVRDILDITFKYNEEFELEAERMIQETLTNREFDKIVAQLYPATDDMSDLQQSRAKAHQANVRSLFEASGTMTEIKGTRWAGYNAVTEYSDHFVNIPGKTGEAAAEQRALYSLNGQSDATKERAFQLLSV